MSQSSTCPSTGFTHITNMTANGTVLFLADNVSSSAPPTSSPSLTWSVLDPSIGSGSGCFTVTSSLGSFFNCGWYAHNGSNTGTLTITQSGTPSGTGFGHFSPSTDVKNTGNPLDHDSVGHTTFPAGNGTFTILSPLVSSNPEEVFMYYIENDAGASCNLSVLSSPAPTGPTVSGGQEMLCAAEFINYNASSGVFIPSGAAGSFSVQFTTTNSTGSTANANYFMITLLPGTGQHTRHQTGWVNYRSHPRPNRPDLFPRFAILRRWNPATWERAA